MVAYLDLRPKFTACCAVVMLDKKKHLRAIWHYLVTV